MRDKTPSALDAANARFDAQSTLRVQSTDAEHVVSSSDARVVNNTLRHSYRVLNDDEKALMSRIKDVGGEFLALLHQAGNTNPDEGRLASRELSLAQTKIEEAVMWAVKHVTS